MYKPQPYQKESITVAFMIEQLNDRVGMPVEALNADSPSVNAASRRVVESNLHRPGLALAGYIGLFTSHRVQVLGNTECGFLEQLDPGQRAEAFSHVVLPDVPCLFLTDSNRLSPELITMASEGGVPDLRTPVP
jgi:HPr kinase/phosphorylase